MKLWEAQQILCQFQPDAVVYIKLPEGRTVVLDHIEDHYPRAEDECTCLDTEDEDGNEVMDPRVWQDPHFDPIDSECGKHGDESYRMPLFVTGNSHSPEVFYQADEAACANRVLDEMGIPRLDGDKTYSLVGRLTVALEAAVRQGAGHDTLAISIPTSEGS